MAYFSQGLLIQNNQQQNTNANYRVAEASLRTALLFDPRNRRLVIDKLRAYIRQCRAMQIDESAGAALAEPEVSANVVDYFALGLGLYQFFERTSFKTVLSKVKSATIFFSRLFSSSRSRRRLASSRLISPYFSRHL